MKILVIDDSSVNQDAARAQLGGHNLTVARNYDEALTLVRRKHKFDVVLADLLMEPSAQSLGDRFWKFEDEEMPVGIFLALLAAKNGAKYVAVFSDSDHHSHPASACLDAFNKGEEEPTAFPVGTAKFLLTNNRNWVETFYKTNLAESADVSFNEFSKDENRPESKRLYVKAKDWKSLLEYLTHDNPKRARR